MSEVRNSSANELDNDSALSFKINLFAINTQNLIKRKKIFNLHVTKKTKKTKKKRADAGRSLQKWLIQPDLKWISA